MHKKLRKTTNLCVEIMNSKLHVTGKLGHVASPQAFSVNALR